MEEESQGLPSLGETEIEIPQVEEEHIQVVMEEQDASSMDVNVSEPSVGQELAEDHIQVVPAGDDDVDEGGDDDVDLDVLDVVDSNSDSDNGSEGGEWMLKGSIKAISKMCCSLVSLFAFVVNFMVGYAIQGSHATLETTMTYTIDTAFTLTLCIQRTFHILWIILANSIPVIVKVLGIMTFIILLFVSLCYLMFKCRVLHRFCRLLDKNSSPLATIFLGSLALVHNYRLLIFNAINNRLAWRNTTHHFVKNLQKKDHIMCTSLDATLIPPGGACTLCPEDSHVNPAQADESD